MFAYLMPNNNYLNYEMHNAQSRTLKSTLAKLTIHYVET